MADISAIGFAPDNNTPYSELLASGYEQNFLPTPVLQDNCFEDNVEPLLRLHEHFHDQDVGYVTDNPSTSNADRDTEPESLCGFYDSREQLNDSTDNPGGAPYLPSDFPTDSQCVEDSGVEFNLGTYNFGDYERTNKPFSYDTEQGNYGDSLRSDPPYDPGYNMTGYADFHQSTGGHRISPGSNLGLSNDEQILGSATDSMQSPEFQPYEYNQEDPTNEMDDYRLGAPRVLPASFNTQDYDESRFPAFNSMHNGYHSEGDYPGSTLSHLGKTPELNTWQHAALSAAYADATKAAALRALVEASFFPQSPDLYDKLGRSLTGGGNLDYHPVYGVYRNTPSSESPSSLLDTPNLGLLLNSPTFDSPIRDPSPRVVKGRSSSSKKGAGPDFETKLLPRPAFASSCVSGGSFMMVNLRMKKGGQKKKCSGNISGVGKRGPGSKPKSLNEQTDTWRVGNSES